MRTRVWLIIMLLFSMSCNLTTILANGGNKRAGTNHPSSSASTLTALLNEVKGTVQARQPDQSDYATASDGLTLQLQGLVKTGNDGRARLDLSSGTIVRVAPSSVFALTDNQAVDNSLATQLKLELGKLWVVLRGGTLNIETPSGQALVRGSFISVAVDPGTTGVYVTCLEGTCALQNPAGTLALSTGQTGRLLPPTNNVYIAPQLGTMTPEDFQDWKDNVPEAAELIPAISATVSAAVPTPVNVPCVMTLSGAVSKTLACTVEFAYLAADGTTNLRILSDAQATTAGGALPEAQFIAQLSGAIKPGTYTDGYQAGTVIETVTDVWMCETQSGIGSSSVTLTSMDVTSTDARGSLYVVHGTVTATLEAQVTAGGTITLTITF